MAMLNNQRAIRTYADKPGGIEDLLVFFGTFYVMFLEICRKSEPSVDFMRVGLFPFFTFLASLECSSGITV